MSCLKLLRLNSGCDLEIDSRLFALSARRFIVADALAFTEIGNSGCFQRADMHEYVRSTAFFRLNKSETF